MGEPGKTIERARRHLGRVALAAGIVTTVAACGHGGGGGGGGGTAHGEFSVLSYNVALLKATPFGINYAISPELDVRLAAHARQAGIQSFLRAPALNDAPLFISALKDLVLGAV